MFHVKHIFLPIDNIGSYQCYVVQDKDTIRAYVNTPRHNSTSNYTDFYINSRYLQRTGSQTWGNTSSLPTCLNSSIVTNDFIYSNDVADVLFVVLFFLLILWVIAKGTIFRFFRRLN